MKKFLLIVAALGIVIGAAAQPGNQKKAYPGKPGRPQRFEKMTPEEMVEKRVEMMRSELVLSQEQVKQLQQLFMDEIEYRRENFKRPEEADGPEAKRVEPEKMKQYRLKHEEELKRILGDELYAKWRESHPQGKGRRHRGPRA